MSGIGGYLELELRKGHEYHRNAIKLNTGRNAFEYILRAKKYIKVYLPYYTCDAMLEPINKLEIEHEFYRVDAKFNPVFDFTKVGRHEVFVYTNYFGLNDHMAKDLSKACPNLIIDNSQGFFAKPIPRVDTFYSPRKFFGIPDGAYLYIYGRGNDKIIDLGIDKSSGRFMHLLKRFESSPEAGYRDFKINDKKLSGQPIMQMSKLTESLLKNIDYDYARQRRRKNFLYVHERLRRYNELIVLTDEAIVPMVYPLLIYKKGLKQKLINNKIYCATYWPNVFEWASKNSTEYYFAEHIVPLPVDQRYNLDAMKHVVDIIFKLWQ